MFHDLTKQSYETETSKVDEEVLLAAYIPLTASKCAFIFVLNEIFTLLS